MTQLVTGTTTALEVGPETLRARARYLAEAVRAAAARTASGSDMAQFRAWCAALHRPADLHGRGAARRARITRVGSGWRGIGRSRGGGPESRDHHLPGDASVEG